MKTPRGPRAWPPLVQNTLLASVATLLALGLLEGGARLLEARRPPRPVADYIANWDDWGGEFYTAVGVERYSDYYNRDGLRDREHALEKPPGVRRLIFLGDSTTFGHGLEAREAYPQTLQRLLDARGGGFEVFNVALPGWSTRQQRLAYERLVRPYAPDDVFLGICLNDIPDLQNNLSRPPAWLAALFRTSALVRLAVDAEGRQIRQVEELFTDPPLPPVREGFARLFEEIGALSAAVTRDGARLTLLVFPFRFQLESGTPPPRPQQELAAFARRRGLDMLDLLPQFASAGPGLFLDEDHFNFKGSRLVAHALVHAGFVDQQADRPETPATRRSLAEWLAGLEADEPRALRALQAVAERGADGASAIPGLVRLLKHSSASLRAEAARGLGGIGPAAAPAARALLHTLSDKHEHVRLRAAEALPLVVTDPAPVVAELAQLLTSGEEAGRYAAVRVLGRLAGRSRAAVPALARAVQDPDPAIQEQAVWALGQIGPGAAAAVPALVRALEDDTLRWRAIDVLGRLGPGAAAATPHLGARLLGDPDGDVRRLAARALGRIGPAGHAEQEALVAALSDPRADVRLAAARALPRVQADPVRAAPALERALADPDSGVRAEARSALKKLRRGTR